MIPEVDRYHGVVFRQLLVAHGRAASVGVANLIGRVDAFSFDGAAFQIKHSAKRLSPWQFTYLPENLVELSGLKAAFHPVWTILVCGEDGIVGLPLSDLMSIVKIGDGGSAAIRVSRDRNTMYRISGPLGEVPRAIPRGIEPFLAAIAQSVVDGGPR